MGMYWVVCFGVCVCASAEDIGSGQLLEAHHCP